MIFWFNLLKFDVPTTTQQYSVVFKFSRVEYLRLRIYLLVETIIQLRSSKKRWRKFCANNISAHKSLGIAKTTIEKLWQKIALIKCHNFTWHKISISSLLSFFTFKKLSKNTTNVWCCFFHRKLVYSLRNKGIQISWITLSCGGKNVRKNFFWCKSEQKVACHKYRLNH